MDLWLWYIGFSNNLHVELLGLFHGPKLAWDKGFRVVKCYSDSTHAIQLVSSKVDKWHIYAAVIKNISELITRSWTVVLEHTLHEGNASADILAKIGAGDSNCFIVHDRPPPGLENLLLVDATGVSFIRRH